MYTIEFTLPQGAGGQAALHYSRRLKEQIILWERRYGCPAHRVYHRLYRLLVEFESSEDITLFALTWDEPTLPTYRVIT